MDDNSVKELLGTNKKTLKHIRNINSQVTIAFIILLFYVFFAP